MWLVGSDKGLKGQPLNLTKQKFKTDTYCIKSGTESQRYTKRSPTHILHMLIHVTVML